MIAVMTIIPLWFLHMFAAAEQVPIHWNAKGEIDGYATPSQAMFVFWVLTGTSLGMTALFAGLLWPPKMREELEKIRKLYLGIWLGTLGLMTVLALFIVWMMHLGLSGEAESVMNNRFDFFIRSVFVVIGVLIMALGNHFPKTRQNNVIGVRTRWTLSDTDNWEQTHRFAGKVFILAGGIAAVSMIVMPLFPALIVWTLAILGASGLSYWYSYKLSEPS